MLVFQSLEVNLVAVFQNRRVTECFRALQRHRSWSSSHRVWLQKFWSW